MSDLALISHGSVPRYCIARAGNPMSSLAGGSIAAPLFVKNIGVNGMKTRVLSALAVVLALAAPAAAQDNLPPLSENKPLNDTLFAVLVADEIRKNCDSIQGRVLKGIGMLWNLTGEARKQGYTNEQIEAYRNSEDARAVLRARGDALMAENNVTYDDPQTFCRWGREEIANGTTIGSLLRAN